jgi:hypothetical protein
MLAGMAIDRILELVVAFYRVVAGCAAVASLAWPIATGAGVIRCVSADGRVVYQDKSCPNGAHGTPVDATPNSLGRFATDGEIAAARRAQAEEAVIQKPPKPAARAKRSRVHGWNAGERRFLVTGMTEGEVRRKIGPPDSVVRRTSTTTGKAVRNSSNPVQWVYNPADDDPQTTTTLTFRGNVVVHIDRKVTR